MYVKNVFYKRPAMLGLWQPALVRDFIIDTVFMFI